MFIADFGLMVGHWGYEVKYQRQDPQMRLSVNLSSEMERRRAKNRDDGVYVNPESDTNMSEAVRRYIDVDKIKELVTVK